MTGPIVITGGGTGGHIFPMAAIAERLMALGIGANDVRFVGSRRGQESTLLGSGENVLTRLPGRGLQRSLAPRALGANVGALAGLAGAFVAALVAVGRWRPSVVVSVGGYASLATSLAAIVWRRPLVLVEFDATPGATHRLLGRFATRRCSAFPSNDPSTVVTGAPLRDAIVAIDRSPSGRLAARDLMVPPIDERRLVVVVMTGSLGSTSVNRAVSDLAARWSDRHDRTLIHVAGRRDFASIDARRPATHGLDYRVEEFADMARLWAVADVAVCRAGALTVAELAALMIPSILVPLPGAPGDHQGLNARAMVAVGGARVVDDGACTGQLLATTLDEIADVAVRDTMARGAGSLARVDAATAIAHVVLQVGGFE